MKFILHKNKYPMIDVEPKEKQTYINKIESLPISMNYFENRKTVYRN